MGRAAIRSKASRLPSAASPASTSSKNTKKSARLSRHTSFVSRIEKSTPKSTSARSRRRKKASSTLVTGLESLADALPDDEISQSVSFTSTSSKVGNGKVQKGSMKSRPGAMKRKDKLVRSECERFGKNLAIIKTAKATPEGTGKNSWEMLRGFIGATLERKEEFVDKEKKANSMEE